jgi:hypothetical protein
MAAPWAVARVLMVAPWAVARVLMVRLQRDACPMVLRDRYRWPRQARCPRQLPARCRWGPEHPARCPCVHQDLPLRHLLDRWFRGRQAPPRAQCLRQRHAVPCLHHAMAMHPTRGVAGLHGAEAAILSITVPGGTRTSHGVPRAGSATGDQSLAEKVRVNGSTGMTTRMVSVTCGTTC